MKRVLFSTLLAFALLTFASSTLAASLEGAGTAAEPWLIRTASELRAIDDAPAAYYRLAADVALSGDWTPLCGAEPFSGTLDGAGRAISGLVVEDAQRSGLFAAIGAQGRVENLRLAGRVAAGRGTRAAGTLAGESEGVAIRVVSKGTLSVAADADGACAVGGLVGVNKGIVAFSEFRGSIADARDSGTVGAIVGQTAASPTRSLALPTLVTAHAGFAAKGGAKDSSEDNTLANIVKALRYRPDVVEVDVRLLDGGTLAISHNAPKEGAAAPTLETVLRLLMGELPPEFEGAQFDPESVKRVKIQLDAKQSGLVPLELALIERLGFPCDRVIMAGDSDYESVMKEIEPIRAAVDRGMEFWMNPDRIDSYDALTAKSDAFLERIRSLELPNFTVNSYYGAITPDVEAWLRANGLRISMWTLNDELAIEQGLLRGAHNVTSRLPVVLKAREECAKRGVWGNAFDREKLPEVGAGDLE